MKNKSFAVCIVLCSILSNGVAFASGEGFLFMKEIPLTRGFAALVDDADYIVLSANKWCVDLVGNKQYAVRGVRINGRCKKIYMHRCILTNKATCDIIDHIDGNGLNNQSNNLRLSSKSSNGMNRGAQRNSTTGIKGISFQKSNKKWIVQVSAGGMSVYSKSFSILSDAIAARDEAYTIYHGEFIKK